MSSSFLSKKIISSYFASFSPYHYHYHYHHQLALLSPLLLRHSLSTQPHQQQVKQQPFIAHYLISSFSFSPDRALKYSADRHLAAIKSSERPESVVTFLKDTGLSHDQVKAAVSFHPLILSSSVEKTLKPKVRELIDAGFSRELLVQLIRCNPAALELKNTLSRLLFWIDFVGNNVEYLLKIIQNHRLLISYGIDDYVVPRINLLNEFGLSNRDIVSLMMATTSRFLGQNLDSLRQTLELIEELGIPRGSRMFVRGIIAIGGFRKDQLKRKMKFLMETYGWSEEETHAAFMKFPSVLAFSENKVKSNMDFLIKKAGFESRDIALQPVLLGYSVEKVLFPRYFVISALEAKGLKKKCSLLNACKMSERNFLERHVVPNEKDVPGLGEEYAAAHGGKVSV